MRRTLYLLPLLLLLLPFAPLTAKPPQEGVGNEVVDVAIAVDVPANSGVDIDAVINVQDVKHVSFLGELLTTPAIVRILWAFTDSSETLYSTPTPRVEGESCRITIADGATCPNVFPVAGPFLVIRLVNEFDSPATVNVKVYLQR